MPQLRPSWLLKRAATSVALRQSIVSQPGELRKYEPHPMSPLASVCQFLDDPTIDLSLSIYEVNEIWVGHGDAPICCRL
jgi:hypothetical protein